MSEISPPPVRKKSLTGLDIFLGMICVMFFLDTIGPVAAMGPSAITWSLIITVIFFFPSGLIFAELGATYPEEGGMYAWVKRAYGKRWGARVSWMYWVNNAVWISSVCTFTIGVFSQLFLPHISFPVQIVLTIAMIWLVILVCLRPIKESKWVTNVAALFKLIIAGGIIGCACLFFFRNGSAASDLSLANFRPTLGQSFAFFPALIYNYLGFEVMSSMGSQMKNPARDVPRATIGNAVLISLLYILTTLAILVIIPMEEINIVEGILDTFMISLGSGPITSAVIILVGCMFLSILFAQTVTWIVASSRMAAEAAVDHELPQVFAKFHKKNDTPLGTLLITGTVGTVLTLLYGFMAGSAEDLFWTLFAFTSIIFLIPYLINYQGYLKMRKSDRSTPRPYRFPGPPMVGTVFAHISQIILLFTIFVFFWVPGQPFYAAEALPLLAGVLIALAVGEYLTWRSVKKGKAVE